MLFISLVGFVALMGFASQSSAHPNPNGRPIGWDWWKTYPWSPYNAWKNPYWYPPYNPNYPFPPDQAYPNRLYPRPLPHVVFPSSPDLNVYVPPADPQKRSTPRPPKRDTAPSLTPQQQRELLPQQELAWSRSNLTADQTASGRAINILLGDLRKMKPQANQAPEIPIDPAVLASINVVTVGSTGHIGALKRARIDWPVALRRAEFDSERQAIDSSVAEIADDLVHGKSAELQSLTGALASMRARLAGKIKEMPAPEYIRAKRALDLLDDAVRLLRQPDAANYFNQTYAPKGGTVAQLVEHMERHSLQFAPATEGDEPAYAAIHHALVQYDLAINSKPNAVLLDKVSTATDKCGSAVSIARNTSRPLSHHCPR
jgi:hypothetical protein